MVAKPNVKKWARTTTRSSLWLVILAPILGISAYSMFYVARHLGVPAIIAIGMSTCFDGVVLLSAEYALRYAQAGLSGAIPRAVVLIWAGLAAYVQTFHAAIGHEPAGSWVLWASLPVAAVMVYEIHVRWERRRALAAAGRAYPAPLPSLGFVTWCMFPIKSWFSMRKVVERRHNAIVDDAGKRPVLVNIVQSKEIRAKEPVAIHGRAKVRDIREARSHNAHAPVRHIRQWARDQGIPVSDRARLPQWVMEKHAAEAGGDP